MRVNSIKLHQVLPAVFAGMEKDEAVAASQIWMQDVTFSRGCRTLVSAESGTGKSSLLSFIYGRRSDYMGEITLGSVDARQIRINGWCDTRRNSLALLPQELALFPELTALENVEIKNRLTDARTGAWIRQAFEMLEIDNRADVPAGRMSVGQQQRVAIVRALCQPFDFLLLDEPVSHLDSRNNGIVARLVEQEADVCGAGVIVTSVGNHLALEYDEVLKL